MIKLASNNNLTHNQQEEANRLGINHMDYIMTVLQQINDYNADRISKRENKKLRVRSRASAVVVGHGKDWDKQAIKLKGTDIPIISTDICSNWMYDNHIIPEVIVTFEENAKYVNEDMFNFKAIREWGTRIVGSGYTRQWLEDRCKKEGINFERCPIPTSNVGLFGAEYAKRYMLCDRIILIGINCWGEERYPFLEWFGDWRSFINRSNDKLIINCTESGLLYFDRTLDCDFDNLEIEYGHPS